MTPLSKLLELAEKERSKLEERFPFRQRPEVNICAAFEGSEIGFDKATDFWKANIEERDREIERLTQLFNEWDMAIKLTSQSLEIDILKSQLQMAKDGLREIIDVNNFDAYMDADQRLGIATETMKKLEE